MAISITKLFPPTVLGAASAVLFTMPALGVLPNGRVRLTNTSASAVTVTLYADVAATGSSASNAFLSAVSIAGNGYLDTDVPMLAAGDTLRGLAGMGAAVTVHAMSGAIYS